MDKIIQPIPLPSNSIKKRKYVKKMTCVFKVEFRKVIVSFD
jgi:hypothetical protein